MGIQFLDTGKSTKIITSDREYSCPYGSLEYKKTGSNSIEVYYFKVFLFAFNIIQVTSPTYTNIDDLIEKLQNIDDVSGNSGFSGSYDDLLNKPEFKTLNGESIKGIGNLVVGSSSNYNIDSRFGGFSLTNIDQYGFYRSLQNNGIWTTSPSQPLVYTLEDYGEFGRIRGVLDTNGRLAISQDARLLYDTNSSSSLKFTFVFGDRWNTNIGSYIGLFPNPNIWTSLSALLGRRGIGVYFNTTLQRFVCRCRRTATTDFVLDEIPLSIEYMKISITIISGSQVNFELSYSSGGVLITQTRTITTNVPNFLLSGLDLSSTCVYFEQIGGSPNTNTPCLNRVKIQVL